ncbi:MAG: NAD-dependent epimerase/dehydratase family protein [Leptolyngbyaceae cyanobacterium SU_3_3]|nr:NAD-dependent epimerase/dehydratase family protein [Leptolyngbyaceae cyanobacterium SU_3_3]
MKVFVTGATGFVGQCLCPALLRQGHEVWALVRPSSDVSRLVPGIQPVPTDAVTNWVSANGLPGIDVVIHLAARAHILQDSAVNPEAEFDHTNHIGTANLVRQAIAANVKHFIFISSIGAMATLSDRILTEQTPCHPDTPYGRSKLAAEQALINLTQGSPMTYTILRPTLVYGPGNPGNMERLLKLVKRRLPLPLGAINNQRSFIYVENLVDAILRSIEHPAAVNQTFLVSDGEDLSTPQLIQRLASCLGCSAPLLLIPPAIIQALGQLTGKTDTVSRLLGSLSVDSTKIRETLNWTPPYTVNQGLQATADWFLHS